MESNTTNEQQHDEDPNRPGWCAVCRCAYPCPSTATRDDLRRLAIRYRHAW